MMLHHAATVQLETQLAVFAMLLCGQCMHRSQNVSRHPLFSAPVQHFADSAAILRSKLLLSSYS